MAVFDPEYKHTGLDRIGNIEQYLVNANGGSQTVLAASNGTDDTATIQAVLNAGGNIAAKPGETYHIGSALRPVTGTFLDLTGATLKLNNATVANIIELVSVSNVKIRGGVLDGNRANNTDPGSSQDSKQCNINAWGCDNIEVYGVESKNAIYHGIFIRNALANTNVNLHDNVCHHNGYRGIHCHGDDTHLESFLTVANNISHHNGQETGAAGQNAGMFIAFANTKYVTVTGNVIHDENGVGLSVSGAGSGATTLAESVVLASNVVQNCASYGILVSEGAKKITIADNVSTDNAWSNLAIINSLGVFTNQEMSIHGNQLHRSAQFYGIQFGFSGATDPASIKQVTITENVISDNFLGGIQSAVGTDVENLTISNNVFRGNSGWAINLQAPTTAMRGLFVQGNQSKYNLSGFCQLNTATRFLVAKNFSIDDTAATSGNTKPINLKSCTTGKVADNSIGAVDYTNAGTGIVADSGCDQIRFVDNDVYGITNTAISYAGTNGMVQVPAFYTSPWQSGRYYYAPNFTSVSTSGGLGTGSLRLTPVFIPNRVTVTRIGTEITTIGDVGSKLRLGIYADDGTGRPGALILDAGTIAGDSATVQEITVSQALGPGLYWIGGAVQVVTTTQPTVRVNAQAGIQPNIDAGTTIPGSGSAFAGRAMASVTGALPGTWTDGGTASVTPRVFVKCG